MRGEIITREEMLALPAYEVSDLGQIPPDPLVSVIVITYNHGAYIEQAIEGILAQQCDFPIEVIIGEDKSPDRTLAICQDYQQRYPQLIRLVTWHENVGANANYLRCWGRARGKYVAICEGDDYWIDPSKLSKQVALMEQFPDTSLCGARTWMLDERPGKNPKKMLIGPKRMRIKYSLEDVVTSYLCHTSTFMFRKSQLLITKHALALSYLDGYLQSLSAIQGTIRCLPDVVSVYRQHPGGIDTGSSPYRHCDHNVAVCESLLDIVNKNDAHYVKIGLYLMQVKRCHYLINDGRINEARKMAPRLLRRLAHHDLMKTLILLLHVYLPKPYALIKQLKNYVARVSYGKRI